jgi:hypothetical protein
MPEFFSYDPLTGVRKYFDYDEATGNAHIRSEQDVSGLLGRNAELRNTRACDAGEMQLWATIPPVVQLELRKKGIDIFSDDPSMLKRMRQEIEANYTYLKTTDKRLWRAK